MGEHRLRAGRHDTRGAQIFAEKVRTLIEEETFLFEGRKIPVTISIGVADLDSSVANADDLIQTADRRLYAAKSGGRNRVVDHD